MDWSSIILNNCSWRGISVKCNCWTGGIAYTPQVRLLNFVKTLAVLLLLRFWKHFVMEFIAQLTYRVLFCKLKKKVLFWTLAATDIALCSLTTRSVSPSLASQLGVFCYTFGAYRVCSEFCKPCKPGAIITTLLKSLIATSRPDAHTFSLGVSLQSPPCQFQAFHASLPLLLYTWIKKSPTRS